MGEAISRDLVGKGWRVAMADLQENIMINSVLPGIVHTNIIPKEIVAAVFP
jgi:hypothetical protein